MTSFVQNAIKHVPRFRGGSILPKDFKFSPVFNKFIFIHFQNPIFFPKLLKEINQIDFTDDFLFSFMTTKEEDNYFVFTNKNYFVLFDLKIFSKVYDSISTIFSKSKSPVFIPLQNPIDEAQIQSTLLDYQFKFENITDSQRKMIDSFYAHLFPSQEMINYTIFTKIMLEMFSALIVLSDSNFNLQSVQTILNEEIDFEIGNFYETYGISNNDKAIDTALKYYLKSVEKENSKCYVRIGYINEKRGNIEEAIQWYKKSHYKKDPEGQYRLGLALFPNLNITDKEVLSYLIKSAEEGNYIDSQMFLGDLYDQKKSFPRKFERNMSKSFNYYLMAAENGNKEAFKKAQMLYNEDKDEVIYDTTYEIRFLKISAENNNSVNDLYKLGCIYEDDSVVKKDINKAIYYLEKAADQDHFKSQIELAFLLRKILKNMSKYDLKSIPALKLIQDEKSLRKKIIGLLSLSASKGGPEAQYALGMMYLEQKEYLPANYYLALAAKEGHADSQYQAGCLFLLEKNTAINRAIQYLKDASNNGHVHAHVKLGDYYSKENAYDYDINRAIEEYKKASEAGNAEAQIKLGKLYENNKNPFYNMQEAIKYYRLACDNGNPTGLSEVGRFYYNGCGNYISQNYNMAYEYLSKAARMDDKYAQYYVGLMKYFGHGCAIDIPEAIEWLVKASKQDDNSFTEAMLKLGLLYLNELKPPMNQNTYQYGFDYGNQFVNIDESVKWLSMASKKGCSEASNKLGKMYKKGIKVKKDVNKAIEFYTDAADRNDQKALYKLALIYYEGKATTTLNDIDKAVELLQMIAKTGHIKARIKLAEIYTRPFPKVTLNEDIASDKVSSSDKYDLNNTNIYRSKYYTAENIDEAIKTLKEFQEVFVNAKAILGEIYYKGIKVQPNVKLAIKLLTEASQSGNADSMLFLGRIYYKGRSIGKDKNKAIKYLTDSAKKQNAKAENKLGKIYFLDGNYAESVYWFTQAANHGYDAARYNLGLFYMENRGTKFPKRLINGIQYLEVAATQNYLPALLKLGDFYYKGSHYNDEHFYYSTKTGLPKLDDLKVAITYYKRAADLNSIKAMIKLGEIYERGYDYNLLYSRKDCKKIAISYYERAYMLGYDFYLKNHVKISKNEKKMLYSEHDYVYPAVKLALFQRSGEKVNMDFNTALKILIEASRFDNIAAMNFYAKLLIYTTAKTQEETAKNVEKAIGFLQKASQLGSKKAKIHLALYHFDRREYQQTFDYFNEILLLNLQQHQNPNTCFDVDFEYDLIDKDYDLYAAFFCQLLAILSNDFNINISKCVINFVNHDELVKLEHDNDLNFSFYEGLIEFDDFENDIARFQYYNNNSFDLDDSIMYKSFMRDTLCVNNNFNNFYNKLVELIELLRHDSEFFNNHNDLINKLARISYQKGNPKTALECAILLDDNVKNKNDISNYDFFASSYRIDLNEVLSTNVDNFNHSEFAKSLYKFILDRIPPTRFINIRLITSLNYSNYFNSADRYRMIVPFAHNGIKFAIEKILEDYPNFTYIYNKNVPKFKIENDSDDDLDDFEYQYEFNSINFNKPDDREKTKFVHHKMKINIIENMKHF